LFGGKMSERAKLKLLAVLRDTQAALRRAGNDFAWSRWNSAEEALSMIDGHITAIERGDASRLPELALLFAPTGSIQEVSVSSGWGEEFLGLGARFDKAAAGAKP
jgi:hypothetical protein